MPLWTTARQQLIIDFYEAKVLATLAGMHVFKTPHFFATAQDFAAQVQDTFTSSYKVKYAMFSYETFRDDPTKGCDDDPLVKPTVNLQLYRSIQQARTGQDNSHDLLVDDLINLRNAFLVDRVIVPDNIEHGALVQVGGMVRIQKCEHIAKDEFGSWINLRVTAEVNNG